MRRQPPRRSRRPAGSAIAVGMLLAATAAWAAVPGAVLAASTLNVPAAFPTIQAAIDAAADGDTVLVAPGAYNERIDFLRKDIDVRSSGGRDVTAIDGGAVGVVVKMATDAGETPSLRGFTIRNGGGGSGADSGGIDVTGGPALIEDNLVTGNTFCDGGGIEVDFSVATIRNNVISDNRQLGCSGGIGGGGVSIGGDGAVHLIGNVIEGNRHGSWGGALALFAAGTPTIENNVMRNNTAGNEGGAIDIVNHSDALIQNNLIVGNTAGGQGGAIFVGVPSGERGPIVINNTILGNGAPEGSSIYTAGFPAAARFANNLIVSGGPGAVFECEGLRDPNPPIIQNNDVVATSGTRYGGICADVTGSAGNVSVVPSFVDQAAGNYHLAAGSAGIDAGTATGAPATDADGDPRPLDGDGDGTATIDMGFDEAPAAGPLAVSIDIVPGTSPNVVKLQGKGLTVAVALLSTPGFDARAAVTSSLCFGDAEAPAQRDCTLAKPAAQKDVDRDGDVDLSLVFDTAQTGIDAGDSTACLTGRTGAGRLFAGCDAIVTR